MKVVENFIKCHNCNNLIINIKDTDIVKIKYTGGKRNGVMRKVYCPYCGERNNNIDSYDPRCGGIEKKYRFNI